MLTDPKVSACMVLYHSPADALHAVSCLQESDLPIDFYVVDNSPDDPMAERIRWMCPGAKILPQEKNLGFGRANNVVLPLLHSRYHLMLNPDVTFPPDLISRMVAYMDANPEVVILTPRVFNPDGTEQFLPRSQPTVRYLLSGRLERLGGPFPRLRAEYTLADRNIATPVEVGFATGCFLLIRTSALRQLCGFDERFFLYQEDSDLSRRAMELGRIVYHPEMCLTHAWARENVRTLRGNLRQVSSIIKFFMKWGIAG